MRDDLRKSVLYCDLALANVRNVRFETSDPPEGEQANEWMWGNAGEQNVLQTSLPGETRLPGRFLEQTVEAGVSAPSTRWVLGTLAPHLLLPTGILRKQMEGETNFVWGGQIYARKHLREA